MVFAKFLLRRGTTSEWTSSNPILSLGEPGYDTTTGTLKIGDGLTQWLGLTPINNLDQAPDLSGPVTTLQGDVGALETSVDNLETAVGNLQSSTSSISNSMGIAEGEIDTLQGQVSTLSSTTSGLSTNLSSLDTAFDAYVLDMEKRIRYEYV